jgi:hypothetical protein
MTPEDLAGVLILFLGGLRLAQQPHGKLVGFVAAIAGAVLALLAVDVRSYVAFQRAGSMAGMSVDIGSLQILKIESPYREMFQYSRLAEGLRLVVGLAGAFTLGTLGCAVGSLVRRCQRRRPDNLNPPNREEVMEVGP